MLGLAVKVASLFTANAMSSCIALARYCNSPNSHANGLLWLLSKFSVLALIGIFGSKGVATGFDHHVFSFEYHFNISLL